MTKKTQVKKAKSGPQGGRPTAEFTKRERGIIKTLLSVGEPVGRVASIVGVAENTLRAHFAHEIKTCFAETYDKVVKNFLQRVLTDDSPTAAIFWLKTRGKWSEAPEAGQNAPIVVVHSAPLREGQDLESWLAEAREKAEKAG